MNKLICFILILLSSCAGPNANKIDFASVELSVEKNNQNVSLDSDDPVGEYGPSHDSQYSDKVKSSKKSIALVVLPSMYSSLLALDIIKCLELNDVNLNIIAGLGFSSLLSSLYVQGLSTEEIRWKVQNHLKNENNEIYSRQWLSNWQGFLNREINQNKIIESNKSLWTLSRKGNDYKFQVAKQVKNVISNNINLNSSHFLFNRKFIDQQTLQQIPADIVIVLNTLPNRLVMKKPNESLIGTFGKIHSFIYNQQIDNEKIKIVNIDKKNALDDYLVRLEFSELNNACSKVLDQIK